MSTAAYGRLPDGTQVDAITLADSGMAAKIVTLGASVAELTTKDGADVVLGFGGLQPDNPSCMNCVIGRVAGRTAGPGFELDGESYALEGCDGDSGGMLPSTNCHGGPDVRCPPTQQPLRRGAYHAS